MDTGLGKGVGTERTSGDALAERREDLHSLGPAVGSCPV